MNPLEIIQNMPKVELHLHLEGAFTFEFLFNLINKYGGDPAVQSIADLKKMFMFKDFPHFIKTWFWKNQFFKQAEDFEASTYATLKNLHEQHVVYLEAFYSPWDFAPNGLTARDITEATLRGISKAECDFGIRCQLIADISRDHGWENAVQRFYDITPFRENGVIGIGLGGSEQDYPPQLFKDVFKEAKKHNFHTVAHAGEAAGPESVWTAMEILGIERIGHGVRAVEDARLVATLKQNQMPLEICVTSNLKTGVFPSVQTHPVSHFFEDGLFVTINSDDPTMFGSTITDEFMLLHQKLNFSLAAIRQLTENAVRATFLTDAEKQKLLDSVNDFGKDLS